MAQTEGPKSGEDPFEREEITELLRAWSDGDIQAAEFLAAQVYDDLRRQAHRFLVRERANHTLQTTGLVHEAYIRLTEQPGIEWKNRTHFFGIAGKMMRRILVNYAVSRNREKRGGADATLPLEEALCITAGGADQDLIMLDEALTRLEQLDNRQAKVVELRYFAGLSIEESAEVLEISPATVKREWTMAKAWLKAEVIGG